MAQMTKVTMATVALAASASILVAGCGLGHSNNSSASPVKTVANAATVQNGGVMTIGQATKWEDEFVPNLDGSLYTQNIVGLQFDSLLNTDNKLNFIPWLAQKWKWSNDHKTLTMWLQPNANWSDGQPITSADVLLYLNYMGSKAYNTTLQGEYGYLVSPFVGSAAIAKGTQTSFAATGGFTQISDKEFELHFSTADAASLTNYVAGITPLPSHILGNIPFSQWLDMSYDKQPTVVSGPFIATSVQGETGVTLTANKNYWKGAPHLAGIDMEYVSQAVEPGLLTSGKLDLALNGIQAPDFLKLEKISNVTTVKVPELGFDYLGLNENASPLFKNVTFRQAVQYGTDRAAMIQGIEKGLASPINTALPNISWAYNPAGINPYNYNPAKAESLLKSMGYKMGKDGYFQKSGKDLSFQLTYSQGSAADTQIADLLQQNMKQIGIKLVVNSPIDFNTLFNDLESATANKKIQGWIAGWSLSTDPDPRGLWGSTDAYNLEHWVDKKDDQYIKETWANPADFNPVNRGKSFAAFEKEVNAQVPLNFLYEPDTLFALSKNVNIPANDWSSAGELPLNAQDWSLNQ